MNSKLLIYFGLFVCSGIGSYLPTLWGAGYFSLWSIIGSVVGGIVGIWIGYKLNKIISG